MDIAIIDYGIGNLRSVEKAFQHLGLDARLTADPAELGRAKKMVLPGVGAFGQCLAALRAHGFVEPLRAAAGAGVPLLGICVGLQMLFERSAESPGVEGLGLLPGEIVRFSGPAFQGPGALKIPQIGWNELEFPAPPAPTHPLFAGLSPGSHVYFVHSFFPQPAEASAALAWADYGGRFCCAAGKGNIIGVQFHPEKSQNIGLQILANYGRL